MEKTIIRLLKKNNWSVYIENIDKYSQEEYADVRMDTFGASDSSRLLNVNPFEGGNPDDLVLEKLNRTTNDLISIKPSVRMGRDIEPIILAKMDGYGTFGKVYKPKNMYKDDNTLLSVNFDGVVKDGREYVPLEAKACTRYGRPHYDFSKAVHYQYNSGEWADTGLLYTDPDFKYSDFDSPQTYIQAMAKHCGIPVYYYTQVQQQILALGSSHGYLIVLDVDNWALSLFYVPKDKYTISQLTQSAAVYGMKLGLLKEKARRNNE